VPRSIHQAQPPLTFITPQYSPLVTRLAYQCLPLWMRHKTALRQVQGDHIDRLAHAFDQFQTGKIRLLLAFRHPSVDDPIALGYTFSHLVPAAAKPLQLAQPIHAHFMYDRGIPLWAGDAMGWLYAHLGGTPIQRGKVDRAGLRSARHLFAHGQFPMLAAPEGATNGHSGIISPLQPGVAQLGFWCQEDLYKADRHEQVWILPIGIQYQYLTPPWTKIEQLLGQLEAECGLSPKHTGSLEAAALYSRLYHLGEHLLTIMERHYHRFYHQDFAISAASLETFPERLNRLLNAALTVAEAYFDASPKGSIVDRCRRLEQAAWDNIYREDVDLEQLSPLERRLADRAAEEADLRIWHMRLVESFVSVTGQYVQADMSAERFAETLLLLWDTVTKIRGDRNPFNRPQLGPQRGRVTIAEPIVVSDRWETYHSSRRSAKQAVTDLTQDLQAALTAMLV
jgi:1-acyl-sn-glycerol-3-phosphate acyltransferase